MSKDVSDDPAFRVLKSGSCPSLSGKSKLTYQLGCQDDSIPVLRIATNSGGGFFSDEWLPLTAIEKVLQSNAAKKGLTSSSFRTAYSGKSVNTAGFLLAVLLHAGAVRRREDNVRLYEVAEYDAFAGAIQALMQVKPEKAGAPKGKVIPLPKKPIAKAVPRKR